MDNEAKACLDEIALNMQRNSDAKLAIVGNAASGEKRAKRLAAGRASNTKAYLVKEKGIDASRISAYSGSQDGKVVSTTLIPEGATLDRPFIFMVSRKIIVLAMHKSSEPVLRPRCPIFLLGA